MTQKEADVVNEFIEENWEAWMDVCKQHKVDPFDDVFTILPNEDACEE